MAKQSKRRAPELTRSQAAEQRRQSIELPVRTAHAAVLTAIQCLDGRGACDSALAHTLRAAALNELDKVLQAVRS